MWCCGFSARAGRKPGRPCAPSKSATLEAVLAPTTSSVLSGDEGTLAQAASPDGRRTGAHMHAMQRIHELEVDMDQVRATYRDPEQIWASSCGGYNLVGPDILLAVDAIGGTVLTVKLRCRTAYQHGVHTVLNRPR